MFTEDRDELAFNWTDLGDIASGRPNLGDLTTVTVYRLMQYTMRDVLIRKLDPQTAGEIFYESGLKAGKEFCRNALDGDLELQPFVAQLQQALKDQRVGLLRLEEADPETLNFTLAVNEDLDCSGLPDTQETVCDYDEGFIAGVLEAYTGKPFTVKEVDCWASGGRTCRFTAHPAEA